MTEAFKGTSWPSTAGAPAELASGNLDVVSLKGPDDFVHGHSVVG